MRGYRPRHGSRRPSAARELARQPSAQGRTPLKDLQGAVMTLAAFAVDPRRRLVRATRFVSLALCALLLASGAASAQLVEGKNYDRIKNPQPTESGNKIEVIEFFSYACPHCPE